MALKDAISDIETFNWIDRDIIPDSDINCRVASFSCSHPEEFRVGLVCKIFYDREYLS